MADELPIPESPSGTPAEAQDSTAAETRTVPATETGTNTVPLVATGQQLNKVERELNSFERSTLRWTQATFGILGVTCVFISLQWCEMRSGGKDTRSLAEAAGKQAGSTRDLADRMKDQADETKIIADQASIQSKAAYDLAVAAGIQAQAAKKSADTAQAALRLDQRAWVTAQRGDFKWKNGEDMVFPSRITNTGRTVAKHVELAASATVLRDDDMPEFIYEPGTGHPTIHTRTDILYGSSADSATYNLPVYRKGTRTGEILKLTPQLLADMNVGTVYIVMYGRVTYQDVFGVDHWTDFCDLYPTEARTLPKLKNSQLKCIAYNDIDNNQ